MRRMSFAMTMPAILDRSKTVTRRKGWKGLKVGTRLAAVGKVMGFKRGERAPEPVAVIEVTNVRREPIRLLSDDYVYGLTETRKEGVAQFCGPRGFVVRLCQAMRLSPSDEVTRIEFRYVEGACLHCGVERIMVCPRCMVGEDGNLYAD